MSPKTAAVAREPGRRSRRTSSDVEDAILRATLDILHEVGFEELTIEAVAARSGAAKTAVYRRWPSKVPLVVEALTRAHPEPAAPGTGDLRTDMIALWADVTGRGHGSIERLLPVVVTYLVKDDDLAAQLRERYFQPRLQAAYAMLSQAAARGQIRADADPELAFDLLLGPLAYRWLRGSPPDEETISRLVDLALQGLAPPRPLPMPGREPREARWEVPMPESISARALVRSWHPDRTSARRVPAPAPQTRPAAGEIGRAQGPTAEMTRDERGTGPIRAIVVLLALASDDRDATVLVLASAAEAQPDGMPAAFSPGPLTEAERRILRYLPTNLSAPEIAEELTCSVNTVKTHIRHVYAKLGANSRSEAVKRARALDMFASTRGVLDAAAVGVAAPAAGTLCHGPGTRGRAAGTTVRSAE
jgi:DNA-binding CsgD family transcriptional regulator